MTEPPGQTGWIKDPEESARVAATLKPPTEAEDAITAWLVELLVSTSRVLAGRRISEQSLAKIRGEPAVVAVMSAGATP